MKLEDLDPKITAIVSIAAVLGISMYLGYNGQITAMGVGIMAGIGGYGIAKKK